MVFLAGTIFDNVDYLTSNIMLPLGGLLIVIFAGGRYFAWFPLRGLVSDDFSELVWYQQVLDYLWHIALPVLSLLLGGGSRIAELIATGDGGVVVAVAGLAMQLAGSVAVWWMARA